LPTAGIVFVIKIRFRILAAFEDVRSVWDLQKNEETGKAEGMYSLLSATLAVIL